ncbi:hypothetical protein ARMSODRAFT_963615 [Armillaria solidipes]|uniref:Uncharacterized protein n=1 Tax=Armillaria solidipes TaxID=1076256 RepID=A0A2H3BES1_9AGAR|nr:hypothetical protein ARMSODRAFT_963615 [Armillaria solidipes]
MCRGSAFIIHAVVNTVECVSQSRVPNRNGMDEAQHNGGAWKVLSKRPRTFPSSVYDINISQMRTESRERRCYGIILTLDFDRIAIQWVLSSTSVWQYSSSINVENEEARGPSRRLTVVQPLFYARGSAPSNRNGSRDTR